MRAAILSVCVVLCLSCLVVFSQTTEALFGPEVEATASNQAAISHSAAMVNSLPAVVRVLQSGGSHQFATPGRQNYQVYGGASVEVHNPESRGGKSFSTVRTLHEDNEGCYPSCDACHFSFVVAFDIEPGSGFEGTDDEFDKSWHGDDDNAEITWTVDGAGSGSGWGGINSTPDPSDTKGGKSSKMRFTVSEYLLCGTSKTLTFTAGTSNEGTAPITVEVTLDCSTCIEWQEF